MTDPSQNPDELVRTLTRQLTSLESGLTGFQQLFRAVTASVHARATTLTDRPATETGPLQRALAEREEELHAVQSELAVLRRRLADQPAAAAPPAVVSAPTPSATVAPPAAEPGLIPAGLLAALTTGIEELVGSAAKGMAFRAGSTLGKQHAAGAVQIQELPDAVAATFRLLAERHCAFAYVPVASGGQGELTTNPDGSASVRVVFGDEALAVQQSSSGQEPHYSLSVMMCGLFAGVLERLTGRRLKLDPKATPLDGRAWTLLIRPPA